jgi:hypothetical protein
VDLAQGGHEKIFSIQFQGRGIGGIVEAVDVVPEHLNALLESYPTLASGINRNGPSKELELMANDSLLQPWHLPLSDET